MMKLDYWDSRWYYRPILSYDHNATMTTWSCIRGFYINGLISREEFLEWINKRTLDELEWLFKAIDWEWSNNRRTSYYE